MSAPEPEFLDVALFNGSPLATAELKVSPLGAGFMFGEGVFETVRVHRTYPMFLEAHHARLARSLATLAAPTLVPLGILHERCRRVIAANSLTEGSLKIIAFKERTGWSEIILARAKTYSPAACEAGFRLLTMPSGPRDERFHGMKTLNYLANIQAKRRAVLAGFDEALFLDSQGKVLEGATTNVFIVKNGGVATPTLRQHILPGIMRATVLRLCGSQTVGEREIGVAELREADEAFVTNALLGIMPVAGIDTTTYDLGGNRVTRELIAALRRLQLDSLVPLEQPLAQANQLSVS